MINLGNRLLTSSTPHLEHVRRWYQQVGNARHGSCVAPGVSHFSGKVYTADVTWTTTDIPAD
jgi:hypothetical protein